MQKHIVAMLLLISVNCFAYGPYDAHVVKVKDADTIEMAVNVWPGLVQIVDVRLRGVDAPETRRGKKSGVRIPECEIVAGKKAREFAQAFLKGRATVSYVSNGKYAGRVLGNISIEDKDLADALVLAGHARYYNGGKRKIWDCE